MRLSVQFFLLSLSLSFGSAVAKPFSLLALETMALIRNGTDAFDSTKPLVTPHNLEDHSVRFVRLAFDTDCLGEEPIDSCKKQQLIIVVNPDNIGLTSLGAAVISPKGYGWSYVTSYTPKQPRGAGHVCFVLSEKLTSVQNKVHDMCLRTTSNGIGQIVSQRSRIEKIK